jgi:hypothetical protein
VSGAAAAIARWDLALVSGRRGMRVAPNGVKSLMRFLLAFGVVQGLRETTDDDGTVTIEGQPGPAAHALFHDGEATGVTPQYHELRARFGAVPLPLAFEGLEHPAYYFALEIDGAAFNRVSDEVMARVDSVLVLRPRLLVRGSALAGT